MNSAHVCIKSKIDWVIYHKLSTSSHQKYSAINQRRGITFYKSLRQLPFGEKWYIICHKDGFVIKYIANVVMPLS